MKLPSIHVEKEFQSQSFNHAVQDALLRLKMRRGFRKYFTGLSKIQQSQEKDKLND